MLGVLFELGEDPVGVTPATTRSHVAIASSPITTIFFDHTNGRTRDRLRTETQGIARTQVVFWPTGLVREASLISTPQAMDSMLRIAKLEGN